MSNMKPSLADLIRAAALEESRHLGPPPTSSELARYAAGEMSEGEAERIREHLALRPEGRDEVLALNLPLPTEPPGEEYRVSDDEVDEAWQKLQADLGLSEAATEDPPPVQETDEESWMASLKRWFFIPVPAAAAATMVLVGVVGALLWSRDSPTPRLNVQVVDLLPKEHVVRSGGEPEEARPESARPQVWNLNVTDLTEYTSYEVEILGAGGEVVWSGVARQRTRAGNLNVQLPPAYLEPGTYQVNLYGVAGEDRRPLEEYLVRIAP